LASIPGAGNKVAYSARELRMFKLLSARRRKINSTDLVTLYWKGQQAPFNARVAAMDCLRSLKRKARHNKEPFKIETSGRAGARPLDVWIKR
jgi:hypothetical protein